jgi:ribosomal protein S18 acetylase RimI-like enzyme
LKELVLSVSTVPVERGSDVDEIRVLFREYAASLDINLAYQGFEAELASLPGQYARPHGTLLLALDPDGQVLGCVGVRPLGQRGACEMKRLYVRPAGRGGGAGRALAEAALAFATSAGYREMVLDTLPQLTRAIALYRALGFEEISPYWPSPIPVLYFGRRLGSESPHQGPGA